VRLVLTNTGRRPLAIVRSLLGSEYQVQYTPEAHDRSRKTSTLGRSVVRLTPKSEDRLMYPESEYVLVAPGQDFEAEIDLASSLRELLQQGLMPGVYLVRFSYSYEPNHAEQAFPLIRAVTASAPVRITVGAKASPNAGQT
jgi:hypothetical protein